MVVSRLELFVEEKKIQVKHDIYLAWLYLSVSPPSKDGREISVIIVTDDYLCYKGTKKSLKRFYYFNI